MKYTLYLLLLGLLLGATGCKKSTKTQQAPITSKSSVITMANLIHHRFVIVSMNGKSFAASTKTPELSFGENNHLSGQACNRFVGTADLVNGVMSSKKMAATRMFCPDAQLNELETLFFDMMQKGARVTLENNTLTLKQETNTLVYTLQDLVK